MRNINGYMYANLPGLRMCKGDNVSWHFMGGPSNQMHTVYFYGNTFIRNGNNHDTLGIMEGQQIITKFKDEVCTSRKISPTTSKINAAFVCTIIVIPPEWIATPLTKRFFCIMKMTM